MKGVDKSDLATEASTGKFYTDYSEFLDVNGLRGARIGVNRQVYFGYSSKTDAIAHAVIERMKELGAEIIDTADIKTAQQIEAYKSELTVLLFEYKADLNRYLEELVS